MWRTKWRILALCLVLAACAGDGARDLSLSAALACASEEARFCPPSGCDTLRPGEPRQTPVSLTTPAYGQIGRFCEADACEAAYFRELSANFGWRAEVMIGPGWSRPVGEIAVARDLHRFRLRQPASDGYTEWSGFCYAAGS